MDDIGRWLAQLRKGVVELIVLRLLARDGELHGYAIVREIQTLGRLVAGESTVYPVLKRLEADRLVTSRWVESQTGPPRKYYRISETGAAFCAEAGDEFDALVDSMSKLKGADNG